MDPTWKSLLPPLITVLLAIATRRIIVSLLVGVATGAFLLAPDYNPIAAAYLFSEGLLWKSLADEDHLRVFVFTALMGAMIGVIRRSGGMEGIVTSLSPLAQTRRSGQLLTWALGLIIFIDDYANTLLLGHTMQPLADRLKISREKLAYLVDSTAAPVSGLALISTWIAGEIGYINDGFAKLDLPVEPDGFEVFVASIPYRFYVVWALLFVPVVAWLGRDFGPMLRAEREAVRSRPPEPTTTASEATVPYRWINAVLPIAVAVTVTIVLQYQTGWLSLYEADSSAAGTASVWSIFCAGSSYVALVYGSLLGLCSAFLNAWSRRCGTWSELSRAAGDGAALVLPALAILGLAWALSDASAQLKTGEYLGGLVTQAVWLPLLPTVVFVISSVVAFSTGTSWGTMGIIMPIAIPTAFAALTATTGEAVDLNSPIMLACVGSVLAGAIFGDHCSPISDTTVLSSQASGCHHLAHVWTQMPYALLVGSIAILCGTLPIGFGISVWWLLPAGMIVLVAALLVIGRRAEA